MGIVGNLFDLANGLSGALASGAGAAKNKLDSINESIMESRKEALMPKEPAKVTTKCIGCMAPLSGYQGQFVCCKYCDTEQTL